MAKTVRQQLADLVSGKKPNVFYKGLNTDTTEHLIGNDQYKQGHNVRINSKDSDLGSLQNLQSNKLEFTISTNAWEFEPVTNKYFWSTDGTLNSANTNDLLAINIKFKKSDGTFVQIDGSGVFSIPLAQSNFIYSTSHQSNSFNYQNDEIIRQMFDYMSNDADFMSVLTPSIVIKDESPLYKGDALKLFFIPVDSTLEPDTTDPCTITVSINISGTAQSNVVDAGGNTYNNGGAGYKGTSQFLYYPLALVSFTDYIAAICYNTSTEQSVIKIFTNSDGSISHFHNVVTGNFGIASNTTSIIAEKIEENENYNRIYWTDGVNPIKTINLEATSGFYDDFVDNDDFNLFSKSPLRAIEPISVQDGGSINCGSWSYTYRLKTSDGKSTVFSYFKSNKS